MSSPYLNAFSRLNLAEAKNRFSSCSAKLRRFKHSYTAKAGDIISDKMGFKDLAALQAEHSRTLQILKHAYDHDNPNLAIVALTKKHLITLSHQDLQKDTGSYFQVDFVLNLMFETLRGIRVLQLACNYGPYLYYLQKEEDARVSGIDIAPKAVEYARENGLDVRETSSTNLPFPDQEFDAVISHNFLCGAYHQQLTPKYATEIYDPTLLEVFRVLKPGAPLISYLDDFSTFDNHNLGPFENCEALPDPWHTINPGLSDIRVIT